MKKTFTLEYEVVPCPVCDSNKDVMCRLVLEHDIYFVEYKCTKCNSEYTDDRNLTNEIREYIENEMRYEDE